MNVGIGAAAGGQIRPLIASANSPSPPPAQNLPVCVCVSSSSTQPDKAQIHLHPVSGLERWTLIQFFLPPKFVRLTLSHLAHFGLYSRAQLRCHNNLQCINKFWQRRFVHNAKLLIKNICYCPPIPKYPRYISLHR